MFTQTDALPVEKRLARAETAAYPVGVISLAGGRLFRVSPLAAAGGLLAAGGAAVAGGVLLRRLRDATAPATPMLSRYAVVAAATLAWSATAAATWAVDPLGPGVRFGHPAVGPVLLGALVGFVVVGSLYHVVPFIVWLDRYADRVGLERVPAIDDLYGAPGRDGRLRRDRPRRRSPARGRGLARGRLARTGPRALRRRRSPPRRRARRRRRAAVRRQRGRDRYPARRPRGVRWGRTGVGGRRGVVGRPRSLNIGR
ncbi:hypothetical protein [Halorubrum sp. SD626R]|uniref:hypothetical protein n=1 Tax=Halorubrum sp. SD626R TaxID=1419722 RepID=UPI000B82E540|nr:hypothetical protein [Halorubrum sp. SD626R]TKX82148.1 hypothetical protein EXE53_00640 [Halorubrum sp. SD626R]